VNGTFQPELVIVRVLLAAAPAPGITVKSKLFGDTGRRGGKIVKDKGTIIRGENVFHIWMFCV
jgi:hypothetical protein